MLLLNAPLGLTFISTCLPTCFIPATESAQDRMEGPGWSTSFVGRGGAWVVGSQAWCPADTGSTPCCDKGFFLASPLLM